MPLEWIVVNGTCFIPQLKSRIHTMQNINMILLCLEMLSHYCLSVASNQQMLTVWHKRSIHSFILIHLNKPWLGPWTYGGMVIMSAQTCFPGYTVGIRPFSLSDIIGAHCRRFIWRLQGRLIVGRLSATFQDDRWY